MASLKDEAPIGRIINSCKHQYPIPIRNFQNLKFNISKKRNHNEHACIASLFPACDPPLMTLKAGTGRTILGLPARLAMCCTQNTTKKEKLRTSRSQNNQVAKVATKLYYEFARSSYLVERNSTDNGSSFADSKRDSKDSIGSKLYKKRTKMLSNQNRLSLVKRIHKTCISLGSHLLLAPTPLVLGSIKFMDHEVVNSSLLSRVLQKTTNKTHERQKTTETNLKH